MIRHGGGRGGAACVVLALLVCAGVAACSAAPDPRFSSELRRFDDDRGEANTIVDLPGGDRLSVGSPDGHDIVVQRYDAGSRGWSAPDVVHREPRLWTHEVDAVNAGATVGISVDFWTQEHLDDDYAPEVSVGVVCAEACTPGVRPSGADLSAVRLADDGDYAVFLLPDDEVAVWDGGDEWRTERLEDLGEDSRVRLAGDGSLHAITSTRDRKHCVYTLHTTEPHEVDFTEQASSSAAVQGSCHGDFNGTDEDDTRQVAVWVEHINGVIEFERAEDGWRAVPLPQTHDSVPDTGGRSTLAPLYAAGDDTRVVVFSPDMRTIWSQARLHPRRWTKPRVVFTAPEDLTCRTGRFAPPAEEHDLHARLDCFTGGGGPDGEPDTTVVLVSMNGHVWFGGPVDGAGRYAKDEATFDLVVAGTPGKLFPADPEEGEPTEQELALPYPAPATDPLYLDDESLLRVAPRQLDGRCRATTWSAASPEAEAWAEGVAFDVPLRDGRCPDLHLSPGRAGVRLTADGMTGWSVVLRLEGDTWVVADRPRR